MKKQNALKKKELESFLIQQGFEDIGGDDEGTMFQAEHMNVYINSGQLKDYKRNQMDLSFAYSSDGYYEIKNATCEQIMSVVSIFKPAVYQSTDEPFTNVPRIKFKYALLNILTEFIEKKGNLEHEKIIAE